jgi:alpha-glucuronidase
MRNRTRYCKVLLLTLFGFIFSQSFAQESGNTNGSELWFSNQTLAPGCKVDIPSGIVFNEVSSTLNIANEELKSGLSILFGKEIKPLTKTMEGCLLVGTAKNPNVAKYISSEELISLGKEGFIIRTVKSQKLTVIAGNTDMGVLYGVYNYLRMLRTSNAHSNGINMLEKPAFQRRILNHWDNLNGTVERGYAGYSIWQWDKLPATVSPLYQQYARANASIGINGTVLNNVNATPAVLTKEYLDKAAIIAGVLRPYGIKVYLAVNFSSPKELGKLENSDPLNPKVQQWWVEKAKEIYSIIPDFGGFLVKANSEGLPGPQDYGRTHADGANMLADALKPYDGIVMWRAFVYNPDGNDRAKQAYTEFVPLDGQFRKNVIIQVKNGPVDFQPREPFSPLFGAMKKTTLMAELQITQEYLGFSDHLAYLGTMFEEFLDADTYNIGKNSTIARITDGSVFNDSITAIAGVANIGLDSNWCGHHFAQANWYVFGRLAWNHQLSAKEIATEWLKQTFSHDDALVSPVTEVMMESREAVVNYMMPIGLHHLFGWGHHYGPEPWCQIPGARADWLPSYYHKASVDGIGFNRTATGSNAVAQYSEPLRSMFENTATCPEIYLLWFHHLPWDYSLHNGRTLWKEICYRYSDGVNQTRLFQKTWETMQGKVDSQRFFEVQKKLATQTKEAIWWRDACLLYFQTYANKPIPMELDRPIHNLEDLKKLKFNMTHHN